MATPLEQNSAAVQAASKARLLHRQKQLRQEIQQLDQRLAVLTDASNGRACRGACSAAPWQVEELWRVEQLHLEAVNCIALSEEAGGLVASGSSDSTVVVQSAWSSTAGWPEPVALSLADGHPVTSVAFVQLPTGFDKFGVAAAGDSPVVSIWFGRRYEDFDDDQVCEHLDIGSPVSAICAGHPVSAETGSSSACRLAVACSDSVQIWDLLAPKPTSVVKQLEHPGPVTDLRLLSPDLVASLCSFTSPCGDADHFLYLWDLRESSRTAVCQLPMSLGLGRLPGALPTPRGSRARRAAKMDAGLGGGGGVGALLVVAGGLVFEAWELRFALRPIARCKVPPLLPTEGGSAQPAGSVVSVALEPQHCALVALSVQGIDEKAGSVLVGSLAEDETPSFRPREGWSSAEVTSALRWAPSALLGTGHAPASSNVLVAGTDDATLLAYQIREPGYSEEEKPG
ncbi:unnamed protein product [Polarella glacialis]|uniref:Uncharacterized protein n=1 Tax=Polarella glacialis TaxID=89957 RepID=A0A813J3Z4_POLGL|nr:unnamed protein product [Polarella glacialis]